MPSSSRVGPASSSGHATPAAVIYAVHVASGSWVDSIEFAYYQPHRADNLYASGDVIGVSAHYGGGRLTNSEGGSGGALALSSADRFLMQEHSIFSVIGPEAAAVILERDAARAPEVAASLHLTSADALELGIIDAVVPDDVDATVGAVAQALDELAGQEPGKARRARADAATQRWLVEGPDHT